MLQQEHLYHAFRDHWNINLYRVQMTNFQHKSVIFCKTQVQHSLLARIVSEFDPFYIMLQQQHLLYIMYLLNIETSTYRYQIANFQHKSFVKHKCNLV